MKVMFVLQLMIVQVMDMSIDVDVLEEKEERSSAIKYNHKLGHMTYSYTAKLGPKSVYHLLRLGTPMAAGQGQVPHSRPHNSQFGVM